MAAALPDPSESSNITGTFSMVSGPFWAAQAVAIWAAPEVRTAAPFPSCKFFFWDVLGAIN